MNKLDEQVFIMKSDTMRVTDPCYKKDTWCSGVLKNVMTGEWHANKIVYDDNITKFGNRIGELRIWHKDYEKVEARFKTDIDVGVDSGQAGFFDDAEYPEGELGEYGDKDSFYDKVCIGTKGSQIIITRRLYSDDIIEELLNKRGAFDKEKTPEMIEHMKTATVERKEYDYLGIANVGFGIATNSGYGDGSYDCYVGLNEEGKVVSARIVFIDLNEDEDDFWEDEE